MGGPSCPHAAQEFVSVARIVAPRETPQAQKFRKNLGPLPRALAAGYQLDPAERPDEPSEPVVQDEPELRDEEEPGDHDEPEDPDDPDEPEDPDECEVLGLHELGRADEDDDDRDEPHDHDDDEATPGVAPMAASDRAFRRRAASAASSRRLRSASALRRAISAAIWLDRSRARRAASSAARSAPSPLPIASS